MAITVIDAMNGMGQDWACAEVLRAEVRRLIDAREESRRQNRDDWRSLRADLAAAEQRATESEARAGRLQAILRDTEWHGSTEEMRCPVCMGEPKNGHDDDCVLAIAIGGKRRAALIAPATQPDERAAAQRAALDRLAKRILAEIVYCAPENRALAEEVARVAKIETDLIVARQGDGGTA